MGFSYPAHHRPALIFYSLDSRYYAVNTSGPHARWNRDAFQLLFLLFQMTVTDLPRIGAEHYNRQIVFYELSLVSHSELSVQRLIVLTCGQVFYE